MSDAPYKMSLTDVETAEGREVQFNPTKMKVSGDPQYTRTKVPGLSFQPLSFESKNNDAFSFKLRFDALADGVGEDGLDFIKVWGDFLFSLRCPPDDPETSATGAPHEVLLIWPGWIAIVGVLTKCEMEALRFAPPAVFEDPIPTLAEFDIVIEEARKLSLGAESTRVVGLQRG